MLYLLSPCRFGASRFLPSLTPSSFGFSSGTLCVGVSSRLSLNSMSHSTSNSAPTESSPIASPNDAVAKADNADDVLIQYVVLRRELIDTWPLGSVVTQECHASVSATWPHREDDPHTIQYCSHQNIDSMHKVTLEVKGETQIVNLSEKLTAGGIAHKLWIEQPENIPTCLATKPHPKSMNRMTDESYIGKFVFAKVPS